MPSLRTHTRAFILFVLSGVISPSRAQDYPLQVTTVLKPPYTLYLSDYASAEYDPIQINILLRDLDRVNYKAKLRLTIEGMGISIKTKPTFLPKPIILQGGMVR